MRIITQGWIFCHFIFILRKEQGRCCCPRSWNWIQHSDPFQCGHYTRRGANNGPGDYMWPVEHFHLALPPKPPNLKEIASTVSRRIAARCGALNTAWLQRLSFGCNFALIPSWLTQEQRGAGSWLSVVLSSSEAAHRRSWSSWTFYFFWNQALIDCCTFQTFGSIW